jgi:hypothetical protein
LVDYYRRQERKGHGRLAATLLIPSKLLKALKPKPRPEPGSVLTGFERYDRPLLASYSRSGTNWIRYIIEDLSGKPTPGQVRLHKGRDYFIDRAHQAYAVMDSYAKVMLVLRDYRECLLRHNRRLWEELNDVESFLEAADVTQPPAWYIKNIQSFHGFTGEKHLLYYEDLLAHPEQEIPRLAQFLGLSLEGAEEFVENIEARSKESVQAYMRGGHASITSSNKDVHHHARKHLTEDQKRAFDQYFAERYPDLFDLYLERYSVP